VLQDLEQALESRSQERKFLQVKLPVIAPAISRHAKGKHEQPERVGPFEMAALDCGQVAARQSHESHELLLQILSFL
jgi:hypothetical protein